MMGRIALIADSHWGTRGDDPRFVDNMKLFCKNVFFPTLEQNGIKTVLHLGDMFDRRKYLNTLVASEARKHFIDPLHKGYDFHWLIGNHDTYYHDSNAVNAAREYYPYLNYYEDATEVVIEGKKMLFVPWISPENKDRTYEAIRNSKSSIVMGHLELKSFEMHNKGGERNENGDNPERYYKFVRVFTGHFHHKSNSDNIHYLGACAEYTWNDYDDPRGFHIYDTDTNALEYIQNPYHMFHRIHYHSGMDIPDVENKYVQVFVKAGYVPEELALFQSRLHDANPFVVETSFETDGYSSLSDVELADIDGKSALDLLMMEIDDTEIPINKDKTISLATMIYKRAHETIIS
jgi:hypothetical protein